MPATPIEAFDDIVSTFVNAWTVEAVGDPKPKVIWPTDEESDYESGTEPFVNVDIRHTDRRQATLRSANGKRRWNAEGRATFQISVPLTDDDPLTRAQNLARVITDAFEGTQTSNGVVFEAVNAEELGRVGRWFPIVVSMTFKYTEIR